MSTETKKTVTAEPIEAEPVSGTLAPIGGLSLLEGDPRESLAVAQAHFERRTQIVGLLCAQVIGKDCWIDQGGKPYLEGRGAGAALQAVGLRQRNLRYEPFTDEQRGEKWLRCSFELVDGQDNVVWSGEGSRTYDSICDSLHDVRKSAEKNCWHHAGNDVLGIGGWSWEQLERYGIQRSTRVKYEKGGKGGQQRNEQGARVMSFGRCKGQAPQQLSDEDLAWYANVIAEHVQDPGKARWRDRNQATLDQLLEEQEIRAHARKDVAPLVSS